MTKPLNPEKSKKLRPLRVALAVLIAVLLVLILEKLPTSTKNRPENNQATTKETETQTTSKDVEYYHFSGLLDLLEAQTEQRLKDLGVPAEEYQNLGEYLTKEEIFTIETKAALAAYLDGVYVEASEKELSELQTIFNIDDDYDFDLLEETPAEYKSLTDLLADYHKTLNTVEDYDIIEE